MNIDHSFKSYNRDDLKVVYSLKLDGETKPEKRRIIAKILKLDENNQYGFVMTKPMPTGCIKEHPSLSWLKFNIVLESVSLDDPKGQLFVVDIEFDEKKQPRGNCSIMNFSHPLSRSRKFWTPTNNRLISFSICLIPR